MWLGASHLWGGIGLRKLKWAKHSIMGHYVIHDLQHKDSHMSGLVTFLIHCSRAMTTFNHFNHIWARMGLELVDVRQS